LSPDDQPGVKTYDFNADLCQKHAETMTVPTGWRIIRLPLEHPGWTNSTEDLQALADAVRRAAGIEEVHRSSDDLPETVVTLAQRRHLRVVTDVGADMRHAS
jgi:hypothetical protein